jgi:phage-related protein
VAEPALRVRFFAQESGNEPVRAWLKGLEEDDRKMIGASIQAVQWRWPVGLPICRPMGGGLHEVRVSLPHGIARVMFIINSDTMILLHGFIKKTQTTPSSDLELTVRRQKIVERGIPT